MYAVRDRVRELLPGPNRLAGMARAASELSAAIGQWQYCVRREKRPAPRKQSRVPPFPTSEELLALLGAVHDLDGWLVGGGQPRSAPSPYGWPELSRLSSAIAVFRDVTDHVLSALSIEELDEAGGYRWTGRSLDDQHVTYHWWPGAPRHEARNPEATGTSISDRYQAADPIFHRGPDDARARQWIDLNLHVAHLPELQETVLCDLLEREVAVVWSCFDRLANEIERFLGFEVPPTPTGSRPADRLPAGALLIFLQRLFMPPNPDGQTVLKIGPGEIH